MRRGTRRRMRRRMQRRLFRTAILLFLSSAVLAGCSEPSIHFDNARIREPIPGRNLTAAYVDITNGGPTTQLVSVASSTASSIEFHTTIDDNGMMRMRRLKQIELPAGTTVQLQPGGIHLMVFGVSKLDEVTTLEFTTADGKVALVAFDSFKLVGGKSGGSGQH